MVQKLGIVCKGVSKQFGDLTALHSIDLELEKGDFLVLFGPNGAGKTTLMKILCGLLRPTSGKAFVAGYAAHEAEIREKVGVISHNSFLYNNLTARENLVFYAKLYGIKQPGRVADGLLESVELIRRRNDLIRTFSHGMMQRLSIARALVADPEFVFLDEPFSGLDVHSANLFRDLLLDLHKRQKTVMMITHNINVGFSVATRVAILKSGDMVYNEEAHGKTSDELMKVYLEKVGR